MVRRRGGGKILLVFPFFLVIVILLLWFIGSRMSSPGSLDVVIDGDPVIIASWQEEGSLTILSIPSSLTIETIRGLGKYPIRSLWQLGQIEGIGGDTLAGSLGELTGLSIPFYVGGREKDDRDPLSRVEHIFSPSILANFFTHRYKTNIPQLTLLTLLWKMHFTQPNKTRIILVDKGVMEEVQADGSIARAINQQAVDNILGDEFENRAIREEKLTIRVDNATAWPGLAQSIARKINRIGGNVVSIGNRDGKIDACRLEGTKESLKTKTANYIANLFICEKITTSDTSYTDLTVVIGSVYESRFRPLQALPPQSE